VRLTGTGVAPSDLEVGEMLADEVDFVIGVDTHRDAHALAVVAAPTGGVLLVEPWLAASPRGYRRLLALARAHAPGARVFAVEGTGSYGAGLARFLAEQGERVLEVERPQRARRRGGKSDVLDAVRAARCPLGENKVGQPRAGGSRAALQALLRTREGALEARRTGLCQLRALIVTAPADLREELRGLTRARLLRRCARMRAGRALERRGTRLALRLLARRIQLLTSEERALKLEIAALVEQLAPPLQAEPGVGPITAAQVIVAWSHRGRLRSEAAFARLAGAPPIPASSGMIIRHRLDRGGDRQLNRALHTIIVSRRKHHPPTITYIDRRLSEGKSVREAIRILKRYLARSLYRTLEAMPQPA
jgi:transposase